MDRAAGFCLAVYPFVQLPIAQTYAADQVAKEDVLGLPRWATTQLGGLPQKMAP
jgi:hypothetical protein